jgi:hypothetical protein
VVRVAHGIQGKFDRGLFKEEAYPSVLGSLGEEKTDVWDLHKVCLLICSCSDVLDRKGCGYMGMAVVCCYLDDIFASCERIDS